jgi:hypothetical protein
MSKNRLRRADDEDNKPGDDSKPKPEAEEGSGPLTTPWGVKPEEK